MIRNGIGRGGIYTCPGAIVAEVDRSSASSSARNRRPPARVAVPAAAIVAVAVLALAGCGADSDSSAAGASSVSSSTTGQLTSSPDSSSPDSSSPHPSSDYPASTESGARTPTTDPAHLPPYVDHVDWVQTQVGPSLQIYPTPSGRQTTSDDGADVAWSEVLALAPNADTPGMRAQFDCHWTFARVLAPNKPSWNIEPDRPVVSWQDMVSSRCNPGGPEE